MEASAILDRVKATLSVNNDHNAGMRQSQINRLTKKSLKSTKYHKKSKKEAKKQKKQSSDESDDQYYE